MKRVTQKRSSPSASGSIRIIAGQWRGRRLPVRNAEGLRPTTDRNKETLFNWLMHDVQDAICLDMFAGSGGLGLEALSRYAHYCVFFEKDKHNARQLSDNLNTLNAKAEVHTGDALTLLAQQKDRVFDIVFLDPPFGMNLIQPSIDVLAHSSCIKPGTLLYVEQESQAPIPSLPDSWAWLKLKETASLRYGLIQIT